MLALAAVFDCDIRSDRPRLESRLDWVAFSSVDWNNRLGGLPAGVPPGAWDSDHTTLQRANSDQCSWRIPSVAVGPTVPGLPSSVSCTRRKQRGSTAPTSPREERRHVHVCKFRRPQDGTYDD